MIVGEFYTLPEQVPERVHYLLIFQWLIYLA